MDGLYLNGWSARGGFTRNPYVLGWDPCGSSSGSAVARGGQPLRGRGRHRDGRLDRLPAGNNWWSGLKPTLGLVAQDGIIPIAHSQDTAGPMARTVTDVAILLGVLQSPFGDVLGHRLPGDYTRFLHPGALAGRTDRRGPEHVLHVRNPIQATVAWRGRSSDASAWARRSSSPSTSATRWRTSDDDEFTVLLYEFKVDVARYLAGLHHTSMRTLADLIAFDVAHCPEEMKYFGQEIFEIAETTSGDPADPVYLAARARSLAAARDAGLQAAIDAHHLDAIVIPSAGWSSSHAAVAGYPNLSLPVGFDSLGRPVGLCLIGGFLEEPKLVSLAFGLEQELEARRPPAFRGTPPVWPDAGICATLASPAPAARALAAATPPGERAKVGGPRF